MRPEHADVGNPHRTRVENGRDARANPAHIRVDTAHADARGGGAVANVGMNIDQAWHDVAVLGAHLQHPGGVGYRNVRQDGGNFTTRNTNVHSPVEALPRVQYVPAFDEQVIGHAPPPPFGA